MRRRQSHCCATTWRLPRKIYAPRVADVATEHFDDDESLVGSASVTVSSTEAEQEPPLPPARHVTPAKIDAMMLSCTQVPEVVTEPLVQLTKLVKSRKFTDSSWGFTTEVVHNEYSDGLCQKITTKLLLNKVVQSHTETTRGYPSNSVPIYKRGRSNVFADRADRRAELEITTPTPLGPLLVGQPEPRVRISAPELKDERRHSVAVVIPKSSTSVTFVSDWTAPVARCDASAPCCW